MVEFDGEGWARNLLEHICQISMVREKNPILEEEDHPFRRFFQLDRPDSGSDSE
jgi:hypothetical protein